MARPILCLLALTACSVDGQRSASQQPSAQSTPLQPLFVDVASQSGIDFVHFNGMRGEHYIAEMMGGGAALFDYDNDEDLDVYLVQGREFDAPGVADSRTDRLFRSDLDRVAGTLRFTDVTESSGALGSGYGMGVIAGDYDNDGWIDLYVTNYGPNQLLRNRGDGTFEDVTDRAGPADERWSAAATFFDYDRDGWLDLYVGNYIRFSPAAHTPCPTPSGVESYCGPGAYPAQHDSLWQNQGDGTFREVTRRVGMRTESGAAALGVVAVDVDADDWLDVYVANDSMANNLWMNQGGHRFEDRALLAGVAVNKAGQPEASMGVDAADHDRDGDFDLFLAHLSQESNTLYQNDGRGFFADVSTESGLGLPSMPGTGFGASWLDYDNDGWLDLLVVNGAVVGIESLLRVGDPFPLHQPNQLFHNAGSGTYADSTDDAGASFEDSEVSRGAAFGDVDNDGDTDVVIVNNNGPVRLLLNQVGQDANWAGFRVLDGGRDALGATVSVLEPGAPPRLYRVHTDGSFASSNDSRVLVGLPADLQRLKVEVRWVDGTTESWEDVPVGAYSTLRKGEGVGQFD